MTLKEFNELEPFKQYDLVFTQGDFLEYRIDDPKRYALYSLFMFFVEIEYNRLDNKIIGLVSFEEGKLLYKYSFFRK
ncbi:hypothetical protein [Mesoflavibacter zeaxanthinifaciens]|uniref:hypothetical protein n=1 Tax=Mesoflavibacter zeaxanthinifaciens TaxID=393060 RepID=UPI003A9032D3